MLMSNLCAWPIPRVGLRKVPRREFETKWTGYAALFDYTTSIRRSSGKQANTGLDSAVSRAIQSDLAAGARTGGRRQFPPIIVPGIHPDGR